MLSRAAREIPVTHQIWTIVEGDPLRAAAAAFAADSRAFEAAELVCPVVEVAASVATEEIAAGGAGFTVGYACALGRGRVEALWAERPAAATARARLPVCALDADLLAFVRVGIADAGTTLGVIGTGSALCLAGNASPGDAFLVLAAVSAVAAIGFRNALLAAFLFCPFALLFLFSLFPCLSMIDTEIGKERGEACAKRASYGISPWDDEADGTNKGIKFGGVHGSYLLKRLAPPDGIYHPDAG